MTPTLRPARNSDLPAFARHLVRHMAESGRDGDIHFAPVQDLELIDVTLATERRWVTPLDLPGWGRSWIAVRRTGALPPAPIEEVLAHVDLRGAHLPSALHRAELSMGVELAQRGHGIGRRLGEQALSWAAEIGLAYVDLKVFAHNTRAQRLYRDLGFVETARMSDVFRMPDGTRIDEVFMVRALSA